MSRHRCLIHITTIMWLAILLTACSSNAVQSATPTPATPPTPTTPPAGMVLYQADWSHGLSDWQASPGWKVMGNFIQSDASEPLSLTVPYQPASPHYAVEFRLQVVNVLKGGGYFNLETANVAGKAGYQASVSGLLPPGQLYAIHPEILTRLLPDDAMDAPARTYDYEPGTDWHTYRVEIKGPAVIFLADNRRWSHASCVDTMSLAYAPIHLKSGSAILRISDFRILTI
ncbi:MAG TPA: hypothetical protein VKR06_13920 [Ktedonosporobacter sp.]|nr:hypothetical protein [Ktedonosporobacter sp.]